MAEAVVFLNGEFLPASRARVSVFDRGFLFGDGVYEVIPAYGGRLFRLEKHLDRLERSLRELRMRNPLARAAWRQVLQELLSRSDAVDQRVYLQITRGVAARRAHAFPQESEPTVFAMSSPATAVETSRRAQGVRVVTHEDIRWRRCDVKTTSMVANVLLQQFAREAGAEEALLVHDGRLLEGASSNLFAVIGGIVVTPPAGAELLPGVTRDLVLELAKSNSLPCREDDLPLAMLAEVQELWLTSGSREILPVVVVDDLRIGDGKPGPVALQLYSLFQDYKQRLRTGEDHG